MGKNHNSSRNPCSEETSWLCFVPPSITMFNIFHNSLCLNFASRSHRTIQTLTWYILPVEYNPKCKDQSPVPPHKIIDKVCRSWQDFRRLRRVIFLIIWIIPLVLVSKLLSLLYTIPWAVNHTNSIFLAYLCILFGNIFFTKCT